DRELGLVEIAVVLGQLAIPERRDRVQHLDEQIRDLELLQLLLDLVQKLLVASLAVRWLLLAHRGGCHSSKRLPSGSVAQPNRPNFVSSTRSSTGTPADRSCARIASRSRTR